MQKIYSLLRNNKQTGPYTLEELVGLSLKPFDLIWVDGKSGGWSYPSEIDALEPYLGKTQSSELIQKSAALTPIIPATETASIAKEAENKSSTAPAKHIYISFPTGSSIGKTALATMPVPAVAEEESPEAKLERKAQELRNKIQAFAEGKKEPKADNDLDTKYARSLDDIKEEYTDWLHQQKSKRNIPYKRIFVAAASVVFIFLAGYFVVDKFRSESSGTQSVAVELPMLPDTSFAGEQKLVNVADVKKKRNKKRIATKPSSIVKNSRSSANKIDDYLDSLHQAERTAKTASATNTVNKPLPEPSNEQRKTNPDEQKTSKESSIAFAQLVQLSESTGDEGSRLTVYNNSDRFLNFVAVDVYYYKENDKLLQRKTLYFNKIAPKSSAPLSVPELKKATSVRYQLGLISAEGGLYYAKQ